MLRRLERYIVKLRQMRAAPGLGAESGEQTKLQAANALLVNEVRKFRDDLACARKDVERMQEESERWQKIAKDAKKKKH